MNNSRKTRSFIRVALSGSLFLAACSGHQPPSSKTNKVSAFAPCTVVMGKPSSQELALAAAQQLAIETSPFYKIPAASKGLPSCDLRFYPDGDMGLEYHFRDDNWLQVKRNMRIEYTEQNVRLNLQLPEQPETILVRAEQSAFGTHGCGIDWHQSETQPARDDPSITETIFRGDVCNCQARIRRNVYGRIVGFMLRSAC